MTLADCQHALEINNCGGPPCPSGQKKPHNECQGNSCMTLMSCGVDSCQKSDDCTTTNTTKQCSAGLKKPHYECSKEGKCVRVDSCGVDQCMDPGDCTTTTTSFQTKSCSVKYCSGNACNTKIVKVGINENCPPNKCEVNNDCYKPSDPCAGAQCGICAGKDYGSCPPGYKCVSGYKCVDVCKGYQCGTRDGKNCGTCPSGYKCENYQCVKEVDMCDCKFCNPSTNHCVYGKRPCPCPPRCETDIDCKTTSLFLTPLTNAFSKFQAFIGKLLNY